MNWRTFRKLVHHEWKLKGSIRRMDRSHTHRYGRLLYFALLALAGIGVATYFAINGQLELHQLWGVAIGFPYMLVAMGVLMLRREWENGTFGWWLTLPYSRLSLIGAKFFAAWLRTVAVSCVVYVVISLFAGILTLLVGGYSAEDVWVTMLAGLPLLGIVIGFSPIILSLSLLLATFHYTTLRVFSPILWIGIIGGLSTFYNGFQTFLPSYHMAQRFFSAQPGPLIPHLGAVLIGMVISWVIAYLFIRIAAYLLERKLSI
ncbi:ABC transporter permease [Brevibacillus centrosporus]|uniref:ABC transporter permease n=1 Tax=Brevibacillus centrosporus TaxID=54910 RepID=UPI002E205C00|nr:ABC transporter permease [Brevibacillus centrosporus]